jgi:hypothetical protein
MSTYLDWAEEKCLLAGDLESGACGGSYSEGAIILCTCISAMASRLWIESVRADRKRFVEIVVQFSEPAHDTTKISVPLLVQGESQWRHRLAFTDKHFRLTGANDKTENELLKLSATSSQSNCRKTLRQYSYANILYRDIRCGFAHTYLPLRNARADDPLKGIFDSPAITYVNGSEGMVRQIHFGLDWIAAIAKNIARGMDVRCNHQGKYIGENIGLSPPGAWWIDGRE